MANHTANLDLYKINPATDGNHTFNIDTMLNHNWDKIDDKVGDIEETVGSTQEKVEAIDEKLGQVEGKVSEIVSISPLEPSSYNMETLWMQDIGDSDFSTGGGINIANAETSTQPPEDNSYWFEPI